MAEIIEMTREFSFGGTILPDPDSELTPEDVLKFYSKQYPQLNRGKVNLVSDTGDTIVFEMKKAEFQPDG